MLRRHTLQDLLDVILEAHRQHLVRLVHHQRLHVVQTAGTTFDEVNQSTWRSHYDMHTAFQLANLRADARSAIHRQDGHATQVLGIILQVGGNLEAQLTRRRQYKCLWLRSILGVYPFTGLPVFLNLELAIDRHDVHTLQEGQSKSRGLTCSSLRQSHQVATLLQNHRNRLCLYRHRLLIPHLFDGTQQFGHHAQFFKSHSIMCELLFTY